MNLQQQIGQLIIVGFRGSSIDSSSPVVTDIRERNLGGVILFDRHLAKKSQSNNILSAAQTRKLIADLQEAAEGNLLVTVDQEGGQVNRFKKERGFPTTPAAELLGQNTDTEATIRAARQTAEMLAKLGVNLNFAPVVDINLYPDNPIIGKYQRSFSADPERVTAHARAWITEHHRQNVRCCLKHFPGHGSSHADSHHGFVDISDSWRQKELHPYRTLITDNMVDAVMTGHLFNTALDSEYPATLSRNTITGLLRQELGFSGVIISDDLQMRAITGRYGLEEAACRALAAGVDMLVVGNNLIYQPEIVKTLTAAIARAVEQGKLTEELINKAWQRVQRLKAPQEQGIS